MGSSFISIGSRCPTHSSNWSFSCHSELMAKNMIMLMTHLVPMLLLALLPPPWGLCPPNSWARLLSPPSALILKQFLLRRLLLLIRVLIYSSSCLVLRRRLSSRNPPASMAILPLPSSLQCPDGSHCKTLMLMLASTAFFADVVNPWQSAAAVSIPALIPTVPAAIVVVVILVVVSVSSLSLWSLLFLMPPRPLQS
jgi:hypothetical protein